MHLAERDAYDGDIEYDTEEDVGEPNPYSANEEPDDVHQQIQATVLLLFLSHRGTERPQGEDTEFETLQSEGNADNGNHQGKPADEVLNGNGEPAKDNPDNISKRFHLHSILGTKIQKYLK